MQSAFEDNWSEVTGEILVGDRYFPQAVTAGDVLASVVPSNPRPSSSASQTLYSVAISAAERRISITNSYFVPNDTSVALLLAASRRGVNVRILVPGKVNDVPVTKASARKTLYVANSYFVPDDDFRNMLTDAARRGVDVRILTAGPKTDVKTTLWAGRGRYEQLLEAGIRIYEYQPTMMHAKTMVVDDLFATVGSTNFDSRSFRYNDEIELAIYDAKVAGRLEEMFEADLTKSRPYTYEQWVNRSIWNRFTEWLLLPVRSQL
jgi:cardiolipin synthase